MPYLDFWAFLVDAAPSAPVVTQWWWEAIRAGGALGVVVIAIWKLWPLVLEFIAEERSRSKRLEEQVISVTRKHDEAVKGHLEAAHDLADKFTEVLKEYNRTNAETARQLAILGEAIQKLDKRIEQAIKQAQQKGRSRNAKL